MDDVHISSTTDGSLADLSVTQSRPFIKWGRFTAYLLLLLLLISCSDEAPAPPPQPSEQQVVAVDETAPVATPTPTLSPTPTLPPTETPIPLAALVNNEPILEQVYETKLEQFREWYGDQTPDGQDVRVFTLDNRITQLLLEQAAVELGIDIPAPAIEQSVAEAKADSGGDEAYQVWLETSGFTEETFRAQVGEEMLVQAVLNIVTQDVPSTDEFVRARYIQVDDITQAETVLAELAAGADFAVLVELYSIEPSKAVTKGDLGFFNRGTLFVPEVEEVAFALQPMEVSDIITTAREDGTSTHYVVQTITREPFRALSAEQHAIKLQQHFEDWLQARRDSADIQTFIGFD